MATTEPYMDVLAGVSEKGSRHPDPHENRKAIPSPPNHGLVSDRIRTPYNCAHFLNAVSRTIDKEPS